MTTRHVVVVGAGSCGCVVAERLSRVDDVVVTLIEAGRDRPGDEDLRRDRLPVGPDAPRVRRHSTVDGLDLVRGRGVGGSSVVNGGYFLRGHRTDLDGWDRRWWDADTVERFHRTLDGGGTGGVMSVRRVDDADLHPRAVAFENHWEALGYDVVDAVWPTVGINRIRMNADAAARVSADRAFLTDAVRARSSLRIVADTTVDEVVLSGGVARGVRAGGDTLAADEVILCAGTLASAALLARSDGWSTSTFPLSEHREILLRYRDRSGVPGGAAGVPLLPTVLHTEDGVEIRCYNSDFADHIDGVPRSGPAVGVAGMVPGASGHLTMDAGGTVTLDVGGTQVATDAMRRWSHRVVDMLESSDHADLVEAGSVSIDPVLATSHHAWGTLPMGAATDALGGVIGVEGLRVVDGSILPTALSSGPHATTMMMAARIAEAISGPDSTRPAIPGRGPGGGGIVGS
ncbi:mycofactocin system GMC family oxidoreductase MftG [Williamsia sp. MIQD14]|uniref:mycofactocin system GMC family oxidoreductase MftG n=1 Tax=Williamsia sp. MIQD14 TaxID=3425703 RepID=UPI003DA1A591